MRSIPFSTNTLKEMRVIEFVRSRLSGVVLESEPSEMVALTKLARQLHENCLYPRNFNDSTSVTGSLGLQRF